MMGISWDMMGISRLVNWWIDHVRPTKIGYRGEKLNWIHQTDHTPICFF